MFSTAVVPYSLDASFYSSTCLLILSYLFLAQGSCQHNFVLRTNAFFWLFEILCSSCLYLCTVEMTQHANLQSSYCNILLPCTIYLFVHYYLYEKIEYTIVFISNSVFHRIIHVPTNSTNICHLLLADFALPQQFYVKLLMWHCKYLVVVLILYLPSVSLGAAFTFKALEFRL